MITTTSVSFAFTPRDIEDNSVTLVGKCECTKPVQYEFASTEIDFSRLLVKSRCCGDITRFEAATEPYYSIGYNTEHDLLRMTETMLDDIDCHLFDVS